VGTEQPAEFYDARMERVSLPYEESPWRAVYDTVVSLMPPEPAIPILDVGCGTGRCAEALRRAGYTDYAGFDFSPARVAEAATYVPQFEFSVVDVFSDAAAPHFENRSAFVVTEVLEHVEGDLEIIRLIPEGGVVIFSVPTFDSEGHVRSFPTPSSVQERYGELLAIDEIRVLAKPGSTDRKTFVCRAVRTGTTAPAHELAAARDRTASALRVAELDAAVTDLQVQCAEQQKQIERLRRRVRRQARRVNELEQARSEPLAEGSSLPQRVAARVRARISRR